MTPPRQALVAAWLSSRDDLVLSALCVAGIIAVTITLATDLRASPVAVDAPAVATLTFANAEVRRRPNRTLVWDVLQAGDAARRRDTIFVPPGSSAVFAFQDGSKLEIDQNSLVLIEEPAGNASSVALVRGNVFGDVGTGSLVVRTTSGTAELTSGTRASIDLDNKAQARVDVYAGSAAVATSVGKEVLGKAARRTIDAAGVVAAAPVSSVELTSPEPNSRVFSHGAQQPVTLRWRGGGASARVEVATDRTFARVLARGTGNESWSFVPQSAGPHYWRVVGSDGPSETRKLLIVDNAPPRPLGPANETVLAQPGSGFQLAWSAVPGADEYEVELASEVSFAKPVLRSPAAGTFFWAKQDLPEGFYFWRVRVNEAERGASPFSDVARFRLIAEALPETPQLFDPEFEVEKQRRQ
jgi:hypothetical protein